jgi:hypothetical protein
MVSNLGVLFSVAFRPFSAVMYLTCDYNKDMDVLRGFTRRTHIFQHTPADQPDDIYP